MTRPARPPSPVVRKSPLRHRLHRTTGIATGLILLYLIGTGLPLQLSGPLDLGSRYVSSRAILDWYGIGAPETGWQSNDVSYVGGFVFNGQRPIAEADAFQGAVVVDGLVAVAAGAVVLLFSPQTDGVETVSLTAPAYRIGRYGDRVIIDTGSSLRALHPDTLELVADDANPDTVQWAHLGTLTGTALAPYGDAVRARILTLERLLQDLHSGRAFGAAGEWLVSLASLALVALALSGFWIWWRSR
jgi:hypothetical protein